MKRSLSIFTGIPILALILASCGSKSAERAADTNDNPKIVEAADASLVQVKNPGQFALVPVELRDQPDELKVTGAVSPDVSLNVPVNALLSGRVTDVKTRLGDTVRKGDVLLTISSPDLALAFQDYQKFAADEALAKVQLSRAQLLYDHGATAQKDLEIAQSTYNKAQVDTRTTAERIRVLGGDPAHVSNLFQIRAPASGVITEQNITSAAGVKTPDNQPNLFTISDLSRVWILCDVYENNLSQVHLGETARITLNAYPDKNFNGRISNVSSVLDPNTRTAKIRVELPNPNGVFRPGMFANVTFFSQGSKKRMVVPSTAVLRLHDKNWVFVPADAKRFRRVEIQAGDVTQDGLQQVLGGIDPSSQVVKNALLFSNAVDNNS